MEKYSLKETKVVHKTDNLQMNIYHNKYRFYLHWHDEFEFIYCLEGSCTVFVDGRAYTLDPGELLFIEGGMLHSKQDEKYNYSISVVIHPNMCGEDCIDYFKKNLSYQRMFRRGNSISDRIIDNIISVNKCFEDRKLGYELRIRSLICDIFALMLENGCYRLTDITSSSNESVKQLVAYVHSSYKSKITLDDLSGRSSYSKSYIIRLFKKHTGKTPLDYINNYRLSRAAELLTNTNLSVLEASMECGFENTGYFIKLFKEKFGLTPLKWKNGNHII